MSQLKVNSIVPVGGLPSGADGGIIQTVQTVKSDVTSQSGSSSGTFFDISGMSATITPSSNSNKVLVTYNVKLGMSHVGRNNLLRILRGSQVISAGTGGSQVNGACFWRINDNTCEAYDASHAFIDEPGTTSATTYKLQWSIESSGGSATTAYLNRRGCDASYGLVSMITLYEISV
tara:strand:+ start:1985 stop:2512 length:528 start_codon:yes stop_codon:yes gene_type:complete